MINKNFIFFSIFFLCCCFVIYYYFQTRHSTETLVLGPSEGETKKKPEDPGGVVIPNSDSLVYEKLSNNIIKNRKVNILPEPEEPLVIKNLNNSEENIIFLDSIDEILANIEQYQDSDANNNSEASLVYDQNKISLSGVQLNIKISDENRFNIDKTEFVSNDEEGYKIQLSVSFSKNDALVYWKNAIKKHAKVLGDAHLITKKIDGPNERIFYIIMAGTYKSLNQAKLVCKKLISRKQNCIIVK